MQTKQTVRPAWMEKALAEAWTESKRRISESKQAKQLEVYAEDPVGFCTSMFGETYTDDTIKIFESVRDNPVTIARSANAVGKTFTAARIAVFFYRVFDDAKVYLTAAPPLDNLRRILWGEIMSIVRKKPDMFQNDILRSLSIARNPQSFITGVAIPTSGTREDRIAKFSGRHAPHLLFIVDEGDAVPDEIYTGIES